MVDIGPLYIDWRRTEIFEDRYNSRWEQDFGPGGSPRPTALNSWMRHVLTTTTINIAGSSIDCEEGDAGSSTACEVVLRDKGDARIPDGFFFNDRVIRDMLPHDIEVRLLPPSWQRLAY